MKKCNRCKKEYELSFFHNQKRKKDGKFNECKECSKDRCNLWKTKNYLKALTNGHKKDFYMTMLQHFMQYEKVYFLKEISNGLFLQVEADYDTVYFYAMLRLLSNT